MFIVKKAPAGRTAGADCLEGEHVMFGNQYAFTVPFLPDLSSGHLSYQKISLEQCIHQY